MTYLLVHGGGTTARHWDRLAPLLKGPCVAIDLPGRPGRPADLGSITVADEEAAILADVAASADEGPLTLVAHSSGGLPVPGVLRALGPRVTAVILSSALAPPEGGCGADCLQPAHRKGLVQAARAARAAGRALTLPAATDPERARRAYGGDPLDDDTVAFLVDPVRCVQDTVEHYFQPVSWAGLDGRVVTYVVSERDRLLPAPLQREMAARLPAGATTVSLDAGHLPAVTHPAALAQLVEVAQARAAAAKS